MIELDKAIKERNLDEGNKPTKAPEDGTKKGLMEKEEGKENTEVLKRKKLKKKESW